MSHPRRWRASRLGVVLLAGLAVPTMPSKAAGQAGPVLVGSFAGLAGGAWVSAALVTGRARGGAYVWRPDQIGWALAPIPVLAVAGGVLGAHDSSRLRHSLAWASLGFAAGAGLGALVGATLWSDRGSAWSGAILGSAAGLLAGGVAGGLDGPDGPPVNVLLARLSLP